MYRDVIKGGVIGSSLMFLYMAFRTYPTIRSFLDNGSSVPQLVYILLIVATLGGGIMGGLLGWYMGRRHAKRGRI